MKLKKSYKNEVLYIKYIDAVKRDGTTLHYEVKWYTNDSDPILNKNALSVYKKILSLLKKASYIIEVKEDIKLV